MPIDLGLTRTKSSDEFLSVVLGVVVASIVKQIIIGYTQRIERSKNEIDVFLRSGIKGHNVANDQLRLGAYTIPVKERAIRSILNECHNILVFAKRSKRKIDVVKLYTLIDHLEQQATVPIQYEEARRSGEESVAQGLVLLAILLGDVVTKHKTILASSLVDLIALVGVDYAVDIKRELTRHDYIELGFTNSNQIIQLCKMWMQVLDEFEDLEGDEFALTKIEQKVIRKLVSAVGEVMTILGVTLRDYARSLY